MLMIKDMHKKILVVDDDPDILDATQFILEDTGYQVTTTEKGEDVENLHTANNHLPDLIILDVLLSGKDGRIICKQLKDHQKTKQIPVLMISAHPDAKRTSLEAGANAFLAKPFEIDDLLSLVTKYTQ